MRVPSVTRRTLAVILSVLLTMNLASCATYSGKGNRSSLTAEDLEEGDGIRVRLFDGEVFEDTFVRATDSELVCVGRTTSLSDVDRIEKRRSLAVMWALIGGALVASLFFSLNQGMSSATWFE